MLTLLKNLTTKTNSLLNNPRNVLTFLISGFSILYIVLGIFRDIVADESLYLRETLLISESFKSFVWPGNLGVGLHGFLFKIPVAIIFIFTGPSTIVATFYNILLSILCALLFYKILNKLFIDKFWVLSGVFLMLTSFRFVSSSPTYLRETPVLLATLILYYVIINRKSKWLIGLSFLLILEAKEHVFFTLAPAYILYVLYKETCLKQAGNSITSILKKIMFELYQSFSLSIIYLILMFFTALIPLNSFTAAMIGLVDNGFEWHKREFSVERATANNDKSIDSKTMPLLDQSVLKNELPKYSLSALLGRVSDFIVIVINLTLSYIGKLAYPRSFSFISVPKIILVPSLLMSIYMTKIWLKNQNIHFLFFSFSYWMYLLIFIIRSSHGRYLFPIVPVIIVFFVYFIKEGLKNTSFSAKVMAITLFFIITGLFFETTFILEKLLLNFLLFILLIFLLYMEKINNPYLVLFRLGTFVFFGISTLAAYLAFSFIRGQLDVVKRFGINKNCGQIMALANNNDKIWVNNIGWGQLAQFYRNDTVLEPEWNWKLQDWIPKKHMLKTVGYPNTFDFDWNGEGNFKKQIYMNKIDKVLLVESTLPKYSFAYQNKLDLLKSANWLRLRETAKLKNKHLYIFDVL